ncbi:glycosyltransferase family 2 protein [uncultured Polaribacter sp.]|uniref:glycosyltransferase n=1 Tax=uncultured Polaribacter sp. TaxID=174711 RepID=UPI0026177C40|nr:glycosyltransferase family 2 protein [uncultured Polaribacter sp.]
MNNQVIVTASIVLYKENLNEVIRTIQCFLSTPLSKKLFLIDNTKNKFYEGKLETKDVKYIAIKENIGFGNGHNKIISEIRDFSKYHLILNPDVKFKNNLIPKLLKVLENFNDVAMIAPKVVFPNGKHQFSCRRYPSPFELLVRRFGFLKPYFLDIIQKGEYHDRDLLKTFNPEYITGCFHIYKTSYLVDINGFDKRYFLYMEDVDICKKIDVIGMKKLYFPSEEITHVLKKGSSKNTKLFFYHLSSAIKYFLKWGFR